jgi:hypothetical protein
MAYVADALIALCLSAMAVAWGLSFRGLTLGRGSYGQGCLASLVFVFLVGMIFLIGPYSHIFGKPA